MSIPEAFGLPQQMGAAQPMPADRREAPVRGPAIVHGDAMERREDTGLLHAVLAPPLTVHLIGQRVREGVMDILVLALHALPGLVEIDNWLLSQAVAQDAYEALQPPLSREQDGLHSPGADRSAAQFLQ